MIRPDWTAPLDAASDAAKRFLASLPDRAVGSSASLDSLRAALGAPLPDESTDSAAVVRDLAAAVEPGLVATPSGRFFGFVIGGAVPAAVAADWLTSAWDQNAGLYAVAPAASVAEEVALGWITELLGLPAGVSGGFVTGGQMANYTGLLAARHHVLDRAGWDVERRGLTGAPPLRVLAGAERHATIDRSLRYLGIGTDAIVPIAADDQGRMRPDELAAALDGEVGPAIVCAQVGNINTGACDDVGAICDAAHAHGAWVHVDGAFGLWAGVSPRLRPLVRGVERADSWATDCHKWLNVPYDSGLALCAHPEPHRRATGVRASYLIHAERHERDPLEWTPEFSRRARGFAVYAAIRALGRAGVRDIVERCCDLARRFAGRLGADPRIEMLADVTLNQVLFRLTDTAGGAQRTRELPARVQADGTCWLSGTEWRGAPAVRISISNWSTDEEDVDRSASAVLRCIG